MEIHNNLSRRRDVGSVVRNTFILCSSNIENNLGYVFEYYIRYDSSTYVFLHTPAVGVV